MAAASPQRCACSSARAQTAACTPADWPAPCSAVCASVPSAVCGSPSAVCTQDPELTRGDATAGGGRTRSGPGACSAPKTRHPLIPADTR